MTEEFEFGFTTGLLVMGLILSPFLTYFGAVFYNNFRMEKIIKKRKDVNFEIPKEDVELIMEAEKILSKHNKK